MDNCGIFLEKNFFKKFYLQLDFKLENSNKFEDEKKIKIKMSLVPIKLLDFYRFDKLTSCFILLILGIIFIIFIYIIFSKLYLRRIISKLQIKEYQQFS